ncbi:hypothetical protein BZG36_03019 [Bifiguratus adelaidae]|uniref:AAA+ ATPase domain-containing protein n=1 Tax=Bifiguratus adelaidae TaxID=1938954 RepID=A0A261XZL5_9FUNG|nr:hypothetical protein BZG36_03019 [Bifiguratus adelaidae]
MTSFVVVASRHAQANRRVYLCIEALRDLKCTAGELVVLVPGTEGKGGPAALGVAWPLSTAKSKEVHLGDVVRQSARAELGDNIIIQPYRGTPMECSNIILVPREAEITVINPAMEMLARDGLCKYYLQDKYVTNGQVIKFACAGVDRYWKVKECQGVKRRAVTLDTTSDEHPDQQPFSVFSVTLRTTITFMQSEETQTIDITRDNHKTALMSAPLTYDSIGGLQDQIKIIRDMVESPLSRPHVYQNYGLPPPKGILLFGPPGTGKTLIARTVAQQVKSHVIIINGPEIIGKFYGETEAKLREIFKEARRKAPTIIFIDEIDALCPKRDDTPTELEKRVVATLLTLMDGVDAKAESGREDQDNDAHQQIVMVIGATNRPNALDPALRRPGRFDREIEIPIPSATARVDILNALLRNVPHDLSRADVEGIAAAAHGYVGADLAAVVKEGALLAVLLEVPQVKWEDIGGQKEIVQKLKESVEWPLQHPESFTRLGIRPPKGILLYGPPGCSKTLLAKALATESGLNFIAVKGPELFSKWVGESERRVADVFAKARSAAPSIVFFDEIDALTVKRGGSDGDSSSSVADRVLSQLLSEMDGIEPLVGVTVVAATNRPDIIDAALLRPGRIDRILFVSPPDEASRREIFAIQMRKMACAANVNIEALSEMSEGCSGAEIVAICQEAALHAMKRDINTPYVTMEDFEAVLQGFGRRITQEMMDFYIRFRETCSIRSV